MPTVSFCRFPYDYHIHVAVVCMAIPFVRFNVSGRMMRFIALLGGASFFIYLTHMEVLHVLRYVEGETNSSIANASTWWRYGVIMTSLLTMYVLGVVSIRRWLPLNLQKLIGF